VITIPDERRREKPPDYEQVTSLPPSYDEALKLNPNSLLTSTNVFQTQTASGGVTNNAFTLNSESSSRPSSSTYPSNLSINKLMKSNTDKTASTTLTTEDEKSEPPPYSITPS
jgi:hypothetical protein